PLLMAPTFHPEVGEFRWITVTVAGWSLPSRMRAWASMAAMGIPTMPGPTTAIFRTDQWVTRLAVSVSGIGSDQFRSMKVRYQSSRFRRPHNRRLNSGSYDISFSTSDTSNSPRWRQRVESRISAKKSRDWPRAQRWSGTG